MKKGTYRVLLMCHECNKVYNGTNPIEYGKALNIYLNTLMKNKDKCQECGENLIPLLEEFKK